MPVGRFYASKRRTGYAVSGVVPYWAATNRRSYDIPLPALALGSRLSDRCGRASSAAATSSRLGSV